MSGKFAKQPSFPFTEIVQIKAKAAHSTPLSVTRSDGDDAVHDTNTPVRNPRTSWLLHVPVFVNEHMKGCVAGWAIFKLETSKEIFEDIIVGRFYTVTATITPSGRYGKLASIMPADEAQEMRSTTIPDLYFDAAPPPMNPRLSCIVVRKFSAEITEVRPCSNGKMMISLAPSTPGGQSMSAFVSAEFFSPDCPIPNVASGEDIRFQANPAFHKWDVVDSIRVSFNELVPVPTATLGRQTIAEIIRIVPGFGGYMLSVRCIASGFAFQVKTLDSSLSLNDLVFTFPCEKYPQLDSCVTTTLSLRNVCAAPYSATTCPDCQTKYSAIISRCFTEFGGLARFTEYMFRLPKDKSAPRPNPVRGVIRSALRLSGAEADAAAEIESALRPLQACPGEWTVSDVRQLPHDGLNSFASYHSVTKTNTEKGSQFSYSRFRFSGASWIVEESFELESTLGQTLRYVFYMAFRRKEADEIRLPSGPNSLAPTITTTQVTVLEAIEHPAVNDAPRSDTPAPKRKSHRSQAPAANLRR